VLSLMARQWQTIDSEQSVASWVRSRTCISEASGFLRESMVCRPRNDRLQRY
jgi:hypothetical protein